MNNEERLRIAIGDVLTSGVGHDTKVDQLLKLVDLGNNNDAIVIGWLEARVKAPDRNQYVDVRHNDGTIAFEVLNDSALDLKMRRDNLLWRPTYKEDR